MIRVLTRIAVLLVTLASAPLWAAGNISPETLANQIEAGNAPLIIDVRTEEEYLAGHVPGARLIPHDQIGEYMDTLASHKGEPIVVYCRSGNRTQQAIKKLEKAGFDQVIALEGSFQAWKEAGNKVEP